MDRFLIIITLVLLASGAAMVYSTSSVMAMKKFGDEYFFIRKHLVFSAAGLALLMISSRIPYRLYKNLAYPILVLAIVLLILVLVPGIGRHAGGARRWLRLGPVTFQPSEFAKLAVVIFLAYSLDVKKDRIRSFSVGFLPNMVIPGFIIALILAEPDLGTAATLSILTGVMSFIGGVRLKHLLSAAAVLAPVFYVVVTSFDYMMKRLAVFADPWKDPSGSGWQMVQSFLAFGSGGVWGAGLGEGKQKLFYLPEAHTDFIFSVIGEELGLVGVALIILLYCALLFGGVRVARRAKDLFGTYLALGLTLMLSLQAAVNMAVVMGALPPKGLPLPFISYGGSSLVMSMIAVGIILNVYMKGNKA
ncbi:MAG: putative lipid II flippase FtsW [Deltaproteobacteria bacterium]|nr:putative lipid II flippase FtsW [Deltaproteobacteria bacterium]